MQVLTKMATIKMLDYTNLTTYCNQFKIAFDKANGVVSRKAEANGILSPCGILNLKMTEGLLITFMIENLTKTYESLASQIRKGWTDENTSLSAVCKDIIQYKVRPNLTSTSTFLITATGEKRKAPIDTYTQSECKKARKTNHWLEQCFTVHPELREQILARQKRQKTKDIKDISEATTSTPAAPPIPIIS